MTYRLGLTMVVLGSVLAACPSGDGMGDLASGGGGASSPGAGTEGFDGAGDSETDSETDSMESGTADGSSGGVGEGTSFGMSDDMPLVASIPDIKQGFVPAGTRIVIEQVPPSSGHAELDSRVWMYVQEPGSDEHMGLRVELDPFGDLWPSSDYWLDLTGIVVQDDDGWALELTQFQEGGEHDQVVPREVTVSELNLASAAALDDALVEVVEPGPLEVYAPGSEPGTVLVSGDAGWMVVDLRPFEVEVQLSPGMTLEHLVGIVEVGSSRPVVLPRSADDVMLDS